MQRAPPQAAPYDPWSTCERIKALTAALKAEPATIPVPASLIEMSGFNLSSPIRRAHRRSVHRSRKESDHRLIALQDIGTITDPLDSFAFERESGTSIWRLGRKLHNDNVDTPITEPVHFYVDGQVSPQPFELGTTRDHGITALFDGRAVTSVGFCVEARPGDPRSHADWVSALHALQGIQSLVNPPLDTSDAYRIDDATGTPQLVVQLISVSPNASGQEVSATLTHGVFSKTLMPRLCRMLLTIQRATYLTGARSGSRSSSFTTSSHSMSQFNGLFWFV